MPTEPKETPGANKQVAELIYPYWRGRIIAIIGLLVLLLVVVVFATSIGSVEKNDSSASAFSSEAAAIAVKEKTIQNPVIKNSLEAIS